MKVYFIIVACLVCGGSLIHLEDLIFLFVQVADTNRNRICRSNPATKKLNARLQCGKIAFFCS